MTDQDWRKLTPSERLNARLDQWTSASGVAFASPELERAYKDRQEMFRDVIQLRKIPPRVPMAPQIGHFPITHAGFTVQEAMHDLDKLGQAMNHFHQEFCFDALASCRMYGPVRVWEILDYKLYRWAGHGLPENSSYQCVEDEYMRGDEYELLINDPSDYFLRTYLPRIFGALNSWQGLSPLTDIQELPFVGTYMVPVGQADAQQAFEKLLEAGRAAAEWAQKSAAIDEASIAAAGVPSLRGGFSKAPFDTIGDTLRGWRAVMLDKFRQPKRLVEAMERLVPLAIDMGIRAGRRVPTAFIPLHKGADGFMSDQDFRTLYWPTLKAVIMGLVEQGVIPYLFVEGGYNDRLDVIADSGIPKGTTLWLFDQTDLKQVRKKFGSWAAFVGNVPVSLFKAGKPADVSDYVQRLIDDVAGDGGFILSTGAVLDDSTPENLHALVDAG
ncbi:MAG: uroporphyrinogen decarboxylase, partial [Chloroflexota bacterium]|nr:uroporphyrinogen decarboxylase [Chloroflexota bacterium]